MLKQICFILFFVFAFLLVDAQEKKSPFSFEVSEIGDITSVIDGGIKPHEVVFLGQFDFVMEFNTENAGLWKGGSITAHLLNNHGATPSAEFAGDLQVYTNIEAGRHTGLFELFYRQEIGRFDLRTGWSDLNADFYWTEFGGLFLNSSFGISPGASLNVPLSIFPLTSPFVYVGYSLGGYSKLQFSVYAGNPGNFETNPYNLKWKINNENGYMNILEYQYINNKNSYLGLKTGMYLHTADVQQLKDSTVLLNNKFGFYAIADKGIIPAKGNFEKGLDAFLQIDIAPADRCCVSHYFGGGFSYHGFLAKENIKDQFGLGLAYLGMSKYWTNADSMRKHNEIAMEFTYQLTIAEHFVIQPDFQYIINPGAGINGDIENVFAGTIRLVLSY